MRKGRRRTVSRGIHNFLQSFRRARLLVLIPALVIAVLWTVLESRNELELRESTDGKVIEIRETLQTRSGSIPMALVELNDKSRFRLMLPPPPPHPATGDRIPLVVEHYRNGKVMYALDWAAWVDSGIGR